MAFMDYNLASDDSLPRYREAPPIALKRLV